MHKEIERKFLVSRADFLQSPEIPRTRIEQAYLAPGALHYAFERAGRDYLLNVRLQSASVPVMLSTPVSAADRAILEKILFSGDGTPKVVPRVRILDDREAVLTLKGRAQGLSRDEFEVPLALDAARLAVLQARSCLRKTRYFVAVADKTFEVDVYEGPLQGLVTAEVEFSETEDPMALALPDWVGQDVSEDARYSNARLAESGLEGKKGGPRARTAGSGSPLA